MSAPVWYKVLVARRSCHGGDLAWSLPTQQPDGSWVPGDWHEVARVEPCKSGLHITATPAVWFVGERARDCQLWQCEAEDVTTISEDKSVARRVRLLAPAPWEAHGVHAVWEGAHTGRAGRWYAYGSAVVEACDSAVVHAYDSAAVRAYDSAVVEACDSAVVKAYGSAVVVAYGRAVVEAYDSAVVITPRTSCGNDARVTCAGEAVHVDRRGAVVVCTVGGAKEAA